MRLIAGVPAGLPGLVHRHSEENPLFMVCALDHMTQRGFSLRENGRWKLKVPLDEIDLEVPENLRYLPSMAVDVVTKLQKLIFTVLIACRHRSLEGRRKWAFCKSSNFLNRSRAEGVQGTRCGAPFRL